MPWRPLNREQAWLLPPSVEELVADDHPARMVAAFVDQLSDEEWSELGVELEAQRLGSPAYHPRALLSVWLYGFMSGLRSSRSLERACREQLPYLYLTAMAMEEDSMDDGSMEDGDELDSLEGEEGAMDDGSMEDESMDDGTTEFPDTGSGGLADGGISAGLVGLLIALGVAAAGLVLRRVRNRA